MEDAHNRNRAPGPSLTPEEKLRKQELEGLQLSRTRVLHDLTGDLHPRHRASLEAGLKYLDDKIRLLS
jgi:hypothetical protein